MERDCISCGVSEYFMKHLGKEASKHMKELAGKGSAVLLENATIAGSDLEFGNLEGVRNWKPGIRAPRCIWSLDLLEENIEFLHREEKWRLK